jgi:hypothetical protein
MTTLSHFIFGKRENMDGILRKEEMTMAGDAGLLEPVTEERCSLWVTGCFVPG